MQFPPAAPAAVSQFPAARRVARLRVRSPYWRMTLQAASSRCTELFWVSDLQDELPGLLPAEHHGQQMGCLLEALDDVLFDVQLAFQHPLAELLSTLL